MRVTRSSHNFLSRHGDLLLLQTCLCCFVFSRFKMATIKLVSRGEKKKHVHKHRFCRERENAVKQIKLTKTQLQTITFKIRDI